MARIALRIRPGTTIRPESDGRYAITAPGGPDARLHPPAVAPLLWVDGRRSQEQIEREMAASGAPLPPGVLDEIFGALAKAEVLERHETEWRPLELAAWPAHRCTGCGASCQGHWVGPLDPAFVAETTGRMPALREKYPRLEGLRPFVRINPGDSALYLNAESGQCLFLDDDRLCILHKEYGSDGKPTICRHFPHVRFEDGQRTRLGVGLMCMTHFDQAVDAETPAPREHWERLHAESDGALYHYYPPGNQRELEEELVQSMPDADDPLLTLLTAVTPRRLLRPGRQKAGVALERLARMHLARVDDVLEGEPIMRALARQRGLLPEVVGAIRELGAEGEGAMGSRPAVASARPMRALPVRRVIDDAVFRFLFLRQYLMFVGLQHATATLGLGLWSALALTDWSQPEADAARRFGRLLAGWMRVVQSPAVRQETFAGPAEVEAMLAALHRFWRS